jgi:hypothetical protein
MGELRARDESRPSIDALLAPFQPSHDSAIRYAEPHFVLRIVHEKRLRVPMRFAVAAIEILSILAFWSDGLHAQVDSNRLRLIVETDAGGDPDDEQSLVRFLLYASEWDVEGIIANRPQARDGENKNAVRDGLGIVRRMLDAYGEVHASLAKHDPRYPTKEYLWERTVAGYDEIDDGVELIIRAVDSDDPRPVWFLNWGTDNGSAESSLLRALDRVLAGRGQEGYAVFKNRLRLASDDQFGRHTWEVEPAFPLWVYPFRPDMDGGRWYHRFSPLTKNAGGFDLTRDVLTGHGPLGPLYPTNTNIPQKEGDTPTFLYLVPSGLSSPDHPSWGSWAGRFGKMTEDDYYKRAAEERNYWCPNVRDTQGDQTNRDFTLSKWAAHLQNDFRARMDWCVSDFDDANHPPVVSTGGLLRRTARAGETIDLDASQSTDLDSQPLHVEWMFYPEPSGYTGPVPAIKNAQAATTRVTIPRDAAGSELHFIAIVTDRGNPPLTRYGRVVVSIPE